MRKKVSELQHGDEVRGLGVVQSVLPANPGRNVILLRPAKTVTYHWNEDADVEVNPPVAPRESDQLTEPSAQMAGLYLLLDGAGRIPKHGSGRFHRSFDDALVEARSLVVTYPDESSNITIFKQVSLVWAEQDWVARREDLL
jgi:hypothetical protein